MGWYGNCAKIEQEYVEIEQRGGGESVYIVCTTIVLARKMWGRQKM